MARLIAVLAIALLAACSAQQGEEAPVLDGRVRDMAGILDPEVELRLIERLDEAERRYGPQVGIVTITSLDGQPIEQFTTDYANSWGLGDKDRDEGLLILVAPNDRKVRISTGLGIEKTYTDDWAQEVIDKTLLPQFRLANYGRGIEGAVDMIVARMKQYPTAPANDNETAAADEAA